MDDLRQECGQPNDGGPSPEWIVARVETLLSHYFQPDRDDRLTEAVMMDWLEDLSGFPGWAIAEACREYRRKNPARRPTPGMVRAEVLALVEERQRWEQRHLAPPKPEPKPKDPIVTPEQATAILEEFGYTPAKFAAHGHLKRMPGSKGREPADIAADQVEARPETVELARTQRDGRA